MYRLTNNHLWRIEVGLMAAAVVAATDLVATVPASVFETLRAQLDLRILPFPIPTMMIATNLCWHARTHNDATAAGSGYRAARGYDFPCKTTYRFALNGVTPTRRNKRCAAVVYICT
jgi:hypothetical protein